MAGERDPRCILSLPEAKAGELIAAWLTEKGYPAELVVRPISTATDALSGAAAAVPGAFEVWVTKLEDAQPATELLAEQRAGIEELKAREARRANQSGPITAVCEECGKSSDWPGVAIGTTQNCPHCQRYMDVPDPEENWDDVDFGTEEDDPSGEEARE